jgi:hypothetical protein
MATHLHHEIDDRDVPPVASGDGAGPESPATGQEGERGSAGESALSATSAEDALRYEYTHGCAGCGRRINTRWKFCRECSSRAAWIDAGEQRWQSLAQPDPVERRRRQYGDDDWPRDTSFVCGCTSSSNPDLTAKDWYRPDPECVSCRGTGRLRDVHRYVGGTSRQRGIGPDAPIEAEDTDEDAVMDIALYEEGPDAEFLKQGWHIETAAPEVPYRAGEPIPRGRPRKGVEDEGEIWLALFDVLEQNPDLVANLGATESSEWPGLYFLSPEQWRDLMGVLLNELDDVLPINMNAAQRALVHYPRSTLYRMKANGKRVRHNSPKGGEGDDEMQVLEKLEQVAAAQERLEAQLRAERDEMFRVLYAFRYGETPAEEWERFLEERDSSADAADAPG